MKSDQLIRQKYPLEFTGSKRQGLTLCSAVYEQNEGAEGRWFSGAEFISRAALTGLGADGYGSWATFGVGGLVTWTDVNDWRADAGNTLINAGFDNFGNLYNNPGTDPVQWDIHQLRSEQQALQPVHEKYLEGQTVFTGISNFMTDTDKNPLYNNSLISLDNNQGMPGGIDILSYESRIKFGCKLLGYTEAQGCKP